MRVGLSRDRHKDELKTDNRLGNLLICAGEKLINKFSNTLLSLTDTILV